MTKPRTTEKLLIDPEAKLRAVLDNAEEYRGLAIRSATKSSLCWQTVAKTVGPNMPRYAYSEASYPAHQLGSCVDLVTVHEDGAFVLCVRQ